MTIDGLSVEIIADIHIESEVSAVIGLVFDTSGKLLVINNHRGWDFPGGHVEADETPSEALKRELLEEASATIKNVQPFLSAGNDKVMIFYIALLEKLLPFEGRHETTARKLIDAWAFEDIYVGGTPDLVKHVLTEAQKRL